VEVLRPYRKNPDLVLVDTQVIALSPLGCWWRAWAMPCDMVRGCNLRASGRQEHERWPIHAERLALAKLCYRTLLADGADALNAVQTQVVTPALERIVEANTLLSGIGFESSGLAAAHAIHNG